MDAASINPRGLAEELSPSVGMRNASVHEYLEIGLGKVAASVPLAWRGTGGT